jgi:Helix-turn-helix domain
MSTYVSLHELNSDSSKTKPEWVRIPEATRIFGIGRSTLYVLIGEGKVKSCSLRKRGAIRGIRLLSYDSLAAFIEQQSGPLNPGNK